jgi:membrane-bound metal-dependent hydrolase YbcI (DUF457 family)
LNSIALQHVLLNGTIITLLVSAIILGSLMYNARLWLQDYPKAIREKVPPLSAVEKRQRAVVAVLFMGVLFGGLLLTALQLRGRALSFGEAYLLFFIMLFIFNLFDALVIDLLIITVFKPRFVILPGAEGMEYLFNDYRKHVGDFLKGIVFCAVASLPFAALAAL